eukprot:jgi/Mesen1/222/ME1140869C07612
MKEEELSAMDFTSSFQTYTLPGMIQVCDIGDFFEIGRELGTGAWGVVSECRDRRTGEKLACKSIAKTSFKCMLDVNDVQREVKFLEHLRGHPNVVQLKGAFQTEEQVHLVMELCEEGDLFELTNTKHRLQEREAALLFSQVAQAVAFCHASGVMHRDLKPENILLTKVTNVSKVNGAGGEQQLTAKLSDFGLAHGTNRGAAGLVGSPYYMAPEVIRGQVHGPESDMWSLGVVLYAILSGFLPFSGETNREIYKSVISQELEFPGKPWVTISPAARSLIRRLLTADRSLRPTAAQVLRDPWLLQQLGCCQVAPARSHAHHQRQQAQQQAQPLAQQPQQLQSRRSLEPAGVLAGAAPLLQGQRHRIVPVTVISSCNKSAPPLNHGICP